MKKNIIALAIASAIAAPVAMADAPTVYGQINMAVDQVSVKDSLNNKDDLKSGTQVNSRASRFGIKGSEDLGNGLKAVYQLEFEVAIDKDTSSNDSIANRNQFVGLSGGFGTVLMGRHDTPTKMIQGTDFFNDSPYGDIGKMADGMGAFGKGMENRLSNVLAYVSPEFSGAKLIAAFVPKETSGYDGSESSLSDLMSFGVTYGSAKKGLYLAAGMDMASKNYNGTSTVPLTTDGAKGEEVTHTRIVAQYATDTIIANAMYQDFGGKALKDTSEEGTTMSVGVGMKFGAFMPKAQMMLVDRTENTAGVKFEDSTNYALGLDYAFGKKTTGYVEYVMLDNKGGAADTKAETSAFSVGLVHKF
jgi:predicted porin